MANSAKRLNKRKIKLLATKKDKKKKKTQLAGRVGKGKNFTYKCISLVDTLLLMTK